MNRLEKRQQFLKEFIEKGTQLHNLAKYGVSSAMKLDATLQKVSLSDFYQWVKKGCQIKNSY